MKKSFLFLVAFIGIMNVNIHAIEGLPQDPTRWDGVTVLSRGPAQSFSYNGFNFFNQYQYPAVKVGNVSTKVMLAVIEIPSDTLHYVRIYAPLVSPGYPRPYVYDVSQGSMEYCDQFGIKTYGPLFSKEGNLLSPDLTRVENSKGSYRK